MKYILIFLLCLTVLLLPQVLYTNIEIFKTPFFMLSINNYKYINIFIIIILSILFSISLKENYFNNNRKLLFITILNYIFYLLYVLFSFIIISPFLSFTFKFSSFIAALYLNEELNNIDNKRVKLLIPYIIWNFYLTLVTLSTFIINQ